MKRKSCFLDNLLCVVLCASLVFLTFFGSEYICDTFLKGFILMLEAKENIEQATIHKNASFSKEESVFSPFGFGGGGYSEQSGYQTPSDILRLMEDAQAVYKNLKKSGDIKEQQFTTSVTGTYYGSVQVNNRTDESINIKSILNTTPTYKKITKEEPYILVYHTHTTEGYELLDMGWYSNSYNSRTKDSAKNMVRVGESLVEALEEAGYKVIHDKTIYDSQYNGAYSRSWESVKKYLEKYPSIAITLDVHRDAIHYSGGTRCKPTAEINGKKAAQVMIISGCEGDGVEDFSDWKKNLVFALHLQNTVEESFQGLMRPVFFCNRKYNMEATPCSLLLEFGTDGNTLEEAVYSASLIGESIGEMLDKELKK